VVGGFAVFAGLAAAVAAGLVTAILLVAVRGLAVADGGVSGRVGLGFAAWGGFGCAGGGGETRCWRFVGRGGVVIGFGCRGEGR
jgi:hypothetical protein